MADRPRDWYGFEDHDGCADIQEEIASVIAQQKRWDSAYKKLPWWKRIFGATPEIGIGEKS